MKLLYELMRLYILNSGKPSIGTPYFCSWHHCTVNNSNLRFPNEPISLHSTNYQVTWPPSWRFSSIVLLFESPVATPRCAVLTPNHYFCSSAKWVMNSLSPHNTFSMKFPCSFLSPNSFNTNCSSKHLNFLRERPYSCFPCLHLLTP